MIKLDIDENSTDAEVESLVLEYLSNSGIKVKKPCKCIYRTQIKKKRLQKHGNKEKWVVWFEYLLKETVFPNDLCVEVFIPSGILEMPPSW